MFTQTAVRGTIEVRVEDAQGNLKQRSVVHNSLTRAALSQLLAAGLSSTSGLHKIFGTGKTLNAGQVISPLPGELGIYCLVSPVSITTSTVFRPYLDEAQVNVQGLPLVSFCNSDPALDGETLDTPNGLIRVTPNCLLTVSNLASYSFEYRNPVSAELGYDGDVRSVVIGQSAEQLQASPIGVLMTPPIEGLPGTWVGTGNYALHHTVESGVYTTYVFKQWGTGTVRGMCSRTYKTTNEFSDFLSDGTDVTWSGSLLVGSQESQYALVKAVLLGATDVAESDCYGVGTVPKTITVQLMYKHGDLNAMTDSVLNLPLTDNLIGLEQYSTPILVDRGQFVEILVSGGIDPQRNGHVNLWRMRISKASLCDGTAVANVWQLVGCTPYAIGSKTSNTADNAYFTGYWDNINSEYYLPVSKVVTNGIFADYGAPFTVLGVRVKEAQRTYPELMITDADVYGHVVFASNYSTVDVDQDTFYGIYQFTAGKDGVKQMVVFGTAPGKTMCDVVLDTVWSGATLNKSIRKDAGDILRVVYSYDLGNAGVPSNAGNNSDSGGSGGGECPPLEWIII